MGGCTFAVVVKGANADAAFRQAVEDARYEHGHGGYTGTIAEKHEFVMVTRDRLSREDAGRLADKLINDGDARIDDKWGPAGCITLDDGAFYFFGWASE